MAALRYIATTTTTTGSRIPLRGVGPRVALPAALRLLHQERSAPQGVDALANGAVKGRTGGGERLGSSSKNAAPQPKITNQSVPGFQSTDGLTEEQRREVDQHNRDFEAKYDRGHQAPGDKVDDKFWGGGRGGGDKQKSA